ncbi:hypothetical protein K1719_039895 [Acacia pycnantha]|nr:hypothetical protein K1719_039895 [Acacia pycnantha]
MYLHPDEEYHPSSVNWFFANGGLLYKKGYESHPTPIQRNGTNLPQDPNNDGSYWLDLPADEDNMERVKRGELHSSKAYMHIKPMFGGTFTDIACIWVDHFDLEFKEDGNKPVVYSSLHGHAIYPKQGTNLQGANGVGIRNDTAATNMVVDMTIGTVEEGRERVAWEVEEASREYGEQFAEEVLGQEGPTGPKVKNYWNGDEVVR